MGYYKEYELVEVAEVEIEFSPHNVKVGDEVYDIALGRGVVVELDWSCSENRPLKVHFGNNDTLWYAASGKIYFRRPCNKTLFRTPKVICDKVYQVKLKRGDPIFHKIGEEILPRYIHSVTEDFVTIFSYGRDEFTWSGRMEDLIDLNKKDVQLVPNHKYSN